MDTYLATMLGVITSFLLWYLGTSWFQYRRNKKASEILFKELKEEISFNIELLGQCVIDIQEELSKHIIPCFIPHRLKLSIYEYAVSSGDLRLLPGPQNKGLIINAAYIADSFNKFIENTEYLLGIFQLKPHDQALRLAHHRLNGLIEQGNDTRQTLINILEEIKQK